MKTKLYTVYDHDAAAYLAIFSMINHNMALRAFTESANDPNHLFCKYPDKYTLFHIGEYDDLTGKIYQDKTHTSLGLASEVKVSSPSRLPADPELFGDVGSKKFA